MRRMVLVFVVLSCLAAGLPAQQFVTSTCGTFESFENTTSFVLVVVYLTDGVDNRSNLSLRNIRQMNIGENVIVCGMGLGEVDDDALRSLSYASNGQEVGRTPLRFDGVSPGEYDVEVAFERGVWRCGTVTHEGERTLVQAHRPRGGRS